MGLKSRADVPLNNYRTFVLAPVVYSPLRPIHKYLNRSKLSLLPSTTEALPNAECTVYKIFIFPPSSLSFLTLLMSC